MRDSKGNEIVVTRKERVREVHEGAVVYRTIETNQKVVDDNTDQIAKTFRDWLLSI